MATEPRKPFPDEELERLLWENAELRAVAEGLRKRLEQLVDAQRKLAKRHTELEQSHKRLMRELEAGQSPVSPILRQIRKDRDKGTA